jgi:hypothetical protein
MRSTSICASVCLLALSCGAGGGGGDVDPSLLLSGTVRSPGGQSIDLVSDDGRIERGGPRSIELPGYLPVPDFTPVGLVRLDPFGNTLSIVARAPEGVQLSHPVFRSAGDEGGLAVWVFTPGEGKTRTIEGSRVYSF